MYPQEKAFFWPPLWTGAKEKAHQTLTGEIGTLRYVYANQIIWTKCYLIVEHEKENYVGSLVFTSHDVSRKVVGLLRTHIGKTIAEIGDLEIS